MGPSDEEDDITNIIENNADGIILKLQFLGEATNQTLISQLAKRFDIDLNILQGKITQTQAGGYGTLFVQVIGEQEEFDRALSFIQEQTSVEVEVIRDVS